MKPPYAGIAKCAVGLGFQFLNRDAAVVIVAPPDARPLAHALESELIANFPRRVTHITDNTEALLAAKRDGVDAEFQNDSQEKITGCLSSGKVCFRIYSPKPDLLAGMSLQKVAELHATLSPAKMPVHPRWPVVNIPYPNESWALQVFPELTPNEALAQLWQAISASFALESETPTLSLSRQLQAIDALKFFLRRLRLCALRIEGRGIDLYLPLDPDQPWSGGAIDALEGGTFYPVLPFQGLSAPIARDGAAGFVHFDRSLILAGERINGVDFKIEKGMVTGMKAQTGEEALYSMLNSSLGTKKVAAFHLPVFIHHPGPTDQAYCNPNMDRSSSYGLKLSDSIDPSAFGFDLFFFRDDLVVEGTDEQGRMHRLDDLLRSSTRFEERCREAEFALPSQGIEANTLSMGLESGKALFGEGH